MKIYIGNLNYRTTEDSLRNAFEAYGQVSDVAIIQDKMTGRSRGFGFVEMPDDTEGQQAIDALNGADLDGRALKVNVARPRELAGPGGAQHERCHDQYIADHDPLDGCKIGFKPADQGRQGNVDDAHVDGGHEHSQPHPQDGPPFIFVISV